MFLKLHFFFYIFLCFSTSLINFQCVYVSVCTHTHPDVILSECFPKSFLIPQLLQSVKFGTWFSEKSLAGSDVYPVHSEDVRTFECFPKNSLGL